jgi:hypothetical protein
MRCAGVTERHVGFDLGDAATTRVCADAAEPIDALAAFPG